MPSFPWPEFLEFPEEFLYPGLLVRGVLLRPDSMLAADLRRFVNCIVEFQIANPNASIFSDKAIISAAISQKGRRKGNLTWKSKSNASIRRMDQGRSDRKRKILELGRRGAEHLSGQQAQ
jgi:hypothetical protein